MKSEFDGGRGWGRGREMLPVGTCKCWSTWSRRAMTDEGSTGRREKWSMKDPGSFPFAEKNLDRMNKSINKKILIITIITINVSMK